MDISTSGAGVVKDANRDLYELFLYAQWKLDPETTDRSSRSKSWLQLVLDIFDVIDIFQLWEWPLQNIFDSALYSSPWQLALSSDGETIAILQESVLEIRASRDDFESTIGRVSVPEEKYHLRKITWCPDSSMIAVSSPEGYVYLYDRYGMMLFKITLPVQNDVKKKFVTGIEFIESRTKNFQWELLIICTSGDLFCYNISSAGDIKNVEFAHQCYLSRSGISCSTYHHMYKILLVASEPNNLSNAFMNTSFSKGLTAWRLINEPPYYKVVFPTEEEISVMESHGKTWWNFIKSFERKDCILKIRISPSNLYVATLHSSGSINIWLFPSLRFYYHFNDKEETRNFHKGLSNKFFLVDVEWRADDRLIIGWERGSISIHDLETGKIISFFKPNVENGVACLTSIPKILGFLVLKCEIVCIILKNECQDSSRTLLEDTSSEDLLLLHTSADFFNNTMFAMTDLEAFKPKKKKKPIKISKRLFRLIGVKKSTPVDLFNRYLDDNEYQKALGIAEEFGIDSVKVYQRQWRNTNVSYESINNILVYINDEEWILDECVTLIPQSMSGAHALIEFGLNFTNKESLFKDEFGNKVELQTLTGFQKKLLTARLTLLDYEEKLQTYEALVTSEGYDMAEFAKFRTRHLIDSAIDLARSCNSHGVETILTCHDNVANSYWLNILDNFPETCDPSEYSTLLPQIDFYGEPMAWNSMPARERDWSELLYLGELSEAVYEKPSKSFEKYELSSLSLTEWYKKRALLIEKLSSMVDYSLKLLELGVERNIQNLEDLYFEMQFLGALVYVMNFDITFSQLSKLSTLEKLKMSVQKCTEDDFCDCMMYYVHPYVSHYASKNSNDYFEMFGKFLVSICHNSLPAVLKYFSFVISGDGSWIVHSEENGFQELIDILIKCIYAYELLDLLPSTECLINKCLNWVTHQTEISCDLTDLEDRLNDLLCEIHAAKLLKKLKLEKSVYSLHRIKKNNEEVKSLISDAANENCSSLFDSPENSYNLLQDLVDLVKTCFNVIPVDFCYEVFASVLLSSNSKELILMAADILCCISDSPTNRHITFEKSVKLVLKAAKKYFDSSRHFEDTYMHLAKCCLLLIKSDDEMIKEELDLLFSMQILSELGIEILPLKVRQLEDRMKIIELCLKRNKNIYRTPEIIYKLAHKLRISRPHSRFLNECMISQRLAEEAFMQNDFKKSAEFCNNLMKSAYEESWKICYNLAECSQFSDNQFKKRLLIFCSVHAPMKILPTILKSRMIIEKKCVLSEFWKLMENQKPEVFSTFTEEDVNVENGFPFNQNIATKVIRAFSLETNVRKERKKLKFAYPFFYASLHSNINMKHVNKCEPNISSYMSDYQSKMELMFLQLNVLNSIINREVHMELVKKALTTCSIGVTSLDSTLALSYLLNLESPDEGNIFFEEFMPDSFVHQLKIYFYALHALIPKNSECFLLSPAEVLSNISSGSLDDEVVKNIKKMISDYKMFGQVKDVLSLECGIDGERFLQDHCYRKDTILGIAMEESYENLTRAIELAEKNNVSVEDVIISHLSSLLLNKSFETISERLNNTEFKNILIEKKEIICERLFDILPTLPATDYQLLISFFLIMKSIDENLLIMSLKPKEHIAVLKKIKSTLQGLNYMDLLSCNGNIYGVLKPLLTIENVVIVSKLVKGLPETVKNGYKISNFFCHFAIDEFEQKCITASFKQSKSEFESLIKYFSKMGIEDIKIFAENAFFASHIVNKLDPSLRKQLLILFTEWCTSFFPRNPDFIEYLHSNLNILNEVWDEECNFTESLKKYLFLLEQSIREQNTSHKPIILKAILGMSLKNDELIYLHKISKLPEGLDEIVASIPVSDSRLQNFEQWKASFLEGEVEKDRLDLLGTQNKVESQEKTIVTVVNEENLNDSNVVLGITKIFDELSLDGAWISSHEPNLNSSDSCDYIFGAVLQKTSQIEHLALLNRYLDGFVSDKNLDKKKYKLLLIKSLMDVKSVDKYHLTKAILKTTVFEKEELQKIIKLNESCSDAFYVPWILFCHENPSLINEGREILNHQKILDSFEEFKKLPYVAISEIFPKMFGSQFGYYIVSALIEEKDVPLLENCIRVLRAKSMRTEATVLKFIMKRYPKGLLSFNTLLNM